MNFRGAYLHENILYTLTIFLTKETYDREILGQIWENIYFFQLGMGPFKALHLNEKKIQYTF